jgi:hypothetical protein
VTTPGQQHQPGASSDGIAEAHGWSGEVRRQVRQGLAIALADHWEGADVR